MTKEELVRAGAQALGDPRDAALLYLLLTGEERASYLLSRGEEAKKKIVSRYESALCGIKSGTPLSYAAGRCYFYGGLFFTDPRALIPRPDTETLIEAARKWARPEDTLSILDLCTGTGCVGITLARLFPASRVTLGDVSEDALSLAEENLRAFGLEGRAVTKRLDLLNPADFGEEEFSLLAMNPPYIREGEIFSLDASVREFEPRLALSGGEDGLCFYRAFFKNAAKALKKGGLLLLEIGYDQRERVEEMVKNAGFLHLETAYDLGGHPRAVAARK